MNISPSLHSTSVLDMAIKGPLVKDILNMAGFHIPDVIGEKEKVRSDPRNAAGKVPTMFTKVNQYHFFHF